MSNSPESAREPVREGDTLAGKYRVESVLGAGAMGIVVAAYHLQLDRRVALKFLRSEALESPIAVERFAREARAAARISNEHVARVSDVGTLENGAPYLVMEYLDGVDLARRLQQSGPLPTEQAVDFILQACEAIAEAHTRGIVHRDLKPGNLFLTRSSDGMPLIKVLDFGISKCAPNDSGALGSMTQTTAIVGSPSYMSPEQMKSAKAAEPRSDIWAIGVILYELLTGAPPFTAPTLPELCRKILHVEPEPLRNGRPGVSLELERAVSRCLRKSPGDRYRDIAELAFALAPFGSHDARESLTKIRGIFRHARASSPELASEPTPDATSAAPASAPGSSNSWTQTRNESDVSRRTVWALGVATALAFAVVLTLGVLLVRAHHNAAARASASATPALAPAPVTPVASIHAQQARAPLISVSVTPPAASAEAARPAPVKRRPTTARVPLRPAFVPNPAYGSRK